MRATQRKIIATEFYTIDGKFKQEDGWVTNNFSEDMGDYESALYTGADTLLLGAIAYKVMGSYWSVAKTNPEAYKGDNKFADTMNNIKKIAYSKTLSEPIWNNTEFVNEINANEVRKMKQSPGKNMLIVGSSTIVQQFTNLGLIDEYHFLVHPVILGTGESLLENIQERRDLELLEARPFKNGVVLLRYKMLQT